MFILAGGRRSRRRRGVRVRCRGDRHSVGRPFARSCLLLVLHRPEPTARLLGLLPVEGGAKKLMSALGQKRTSRGFVAMSANDPNPTAAIAQSVVSCDALDVFRQQFAWRQITEVA